METNEHIDALHGVTLAHTAIVSALMGVLRAKGLLSGAELDIIFDAALTTVETSPQISEEATRRARQIVEVISGEMARPPADLPRLD